MGFLLIAGAFTFFTSEGLVGFEVTASLAVPGPLAASFTACFYSLTFAYAFLAGAALTGGLTEALLFTADEGLALVAGAVLAFGIDTDLVGLAVGAEPFFCYGDGCLLAFGLASG